ncbi:MAG: hypothetical protein ABIO49_12590 [Dokdonella sp.]
MRIRFPRSLHLSALVLLCAFDATPALANVDGTLDSSLAPPLGIDPFFGTPGLFEYLIDLGGTGTYLNNDYVAATAVQIDGKILAAGWSWNTYLGTDQNACVLTRFNQDGTLDTTFGGSADGRIILNFNPSTENDCYISALALQGDGKIVAAGNLWDATHGERGIVFRFDANGTRDDGFNNGVSANHGYVIAGDNSAFSAVVIDNDDSIISVGHATRAGFSDEDFFYEIWAGGNGNAISWNWVPFNLGGDNDDRAYAAVLQNVPSVIALAPAGVGPDGIVFTHRELYLVGSANRAAYPDGLANHDCAVVGLYNSGSGWNADGTFGSGGKLTMDFPVGSAGEGDNICRAAVARPGSGAAWGGYGVIVGGESYFLSTLGGGNPGVASNYALADVDGTGAVTREDSFAFFQALPTPGIYNGIFGMVREPNGKLVVSGYAGTSDVNYQLSDAGVIRFNADFSRDSTFGNSGAGLAIMSLDGLGGLFSHQREWATALALDNRGHIVLTGERSVLYPGNDYDWLVGRLNTSDEIFRDSFDGVVPPVQ